MDVKRANQRPEEPSMGVRATVLLRNGSPGRILIVMTIELPRELETELRAVAEKQGRAVLAVVEDAVQQYLDGAAITDLESADVAAVQVSLLGDLSYPADWETGDPKWTRRGLVG
jgi:hypothetical protein